MNHVTLICSVQLMEDYITGKHNKLTKLHATCLELMS